MRQFQKNVFRLASQNKGSFLGAVFIIAIGIFIFAAMKDTLRNLKDQVEIYYEENGMADVFAEVSGISETELKSLTAIPGIAEVSGKMAEDMRLLADGQEEIVTVHLLSYDEADAINRLTISQSAPGREPSECMYLGARMAGVYGYESGESLKLLWNGDTVDFVFAGVCHGPDYIYSIPPGGAMVPDGEVYDIACMEKSRMEEITGRKDSLNELGFKLEPGYTFYDVEGPLTKRLTAYGLSSLVSREDQVSYNMVAGEMGELIATGSILPLLFMAISVFMLYVVLKKMIDRDKSLIGTMKAFGLTDRELMGAYLLEGAAAGLFGAFLGGILACPFGSYMFDMYVDFFNLPDTVYHNYWDSRAAGALTAMATGVAAAFFGVKDILSITPAQAMRQPAPKAPKNLPLPKWAAAHMSPLAKMGCRAIIRNPFREFLMVLAVAFPFSLTPVLLSFQDVADSMFMDQFEKIQVYDLQLSLDRYTSPIRAAEGARVLDGVAEAEAVCNMPVTISHESRSEFAMVYGLNAGSDLWRIMDNRGTFHEPPENGIILNSRVAEKLHVKEGELVDVSCQGIGGEPSRIPVALVMEESFGSGCYMAMAGLPDYFNMPKAANTVLIKAEPGKLQTLKKKLLDTSHVTWMVDAKKVVKSYRDMMGSMLAMIHMFVILSVAAGGILIYNIAMINIRERVTEFGTLMILGGSVREAGLMILMEQMVCTAFGIFLGLPGTVGVKWLIERLILSDSYTIHMTIRPGAYGAGFFICLLITGLAWFAELDFLRKICLTDILKERE